MSTINEAINHYRLLDLMTNRSGGCTAKYKLEYMQRAINNGIYNLGNRALGMFGENIHTRTTVSRLPDRVFLSEIIRPCISGTRLCDFGFTINEHLLHFHYHWVYLFTSVMLTRTKKVVNRTHPYNGEKPVRNYFGETIKKMGNCL